MNFPFYIARRYLFSRKSHNAINIVSGISACGVCFATVALVCVLSVFNGFESLGQGMFGEFDPDLKITVAEGKTFDISAPAVQQAMKLQGVENTAQILEENALLKYGDKQMPATIKGVSNTWEQSVRIDSVMFDGKFLLNDGAFDYAVAGIGIAAELGAGVQFLNPLHIYAPKRTAKVNLARPETSFNQQAIHLSGIFSINQPDYDTRYVIVPLVLAQQLFEYDSTQVTALELKVNPQALDRVQREVKELLGEQFQVKNRYEQQESFFRILKIEKWITYLILCFILLIAVFNIIGSLSMLIIEKRNDIETLRELGANLRQTKRIFFYEGWLISLIGGLVGIGIGIGICLAQQHFGILQLGGGEDYIVKAYPVKLQLADVAIIFSTVMIVSLVAVQYPLRYISRGD